MSEGRQSHGLRLELHEAAEELSDEWECLAERLLAPPFLWPGWILAWTRAFAPRGLRVLTAARGAELVGLLPFIERRGVRTAPVNWHTPVFGFLAADRDVSAALAESYVSGAAVRADLSFLDAADPNLTECRGAAERLHHSSVVRTIMRSPYVQIAGGDWDSYRASLPRKLRKETERCKRRLGEQGSLNVEFVGGDERLEQRLAEGFELENSGWKRERDSAINSSQATRRFYTEVASWADARGWLALSFLRLDGRPIAFDLCLRSGGLTWALKGGFDPAFRRFGPGTLLTYESLRAAFEDGHESYELLGDDDAYKLVWTKALRERVRFQAFSRSPRGRVNHLAWSHGRRAVRRALAVVRHPGEDFP